ncbi:MAG: hypothetical protein ABJF89_02285 [Parasphingorhabdus sp.]|uniref:Cap15 family cyclic dinucleotide receptor domain-containing protein n=1 Tax=Parasphingorhabdus sp. TaxID=2709688 RepID=UPI0032640159
MTDISGSWAMHGIALAPDGSTMYEWDAGIQINIETAGAKVVMETSGIKSSRSISYAEKLIVQPNGEIQLRYGYEADPDHEATQDHDFFGLSQLTFAPDGQTAQGTSCNYNGRYVIMQIELKRA